MTKREREVLAEFLNRMRSSVAAHGGDGDDNMTEDMARECREDNVAEVKAFNFLALRCGVKPEAEYKPWYVEGKKDE